MSIKMFLSHFIKLTKADLIQKCVGLGLSISSMLLGLMEVKLNWIDPI